MAAGRRQPEAGSSLRRRGAGVRANRKVPLTHMFIPRTRSRTPGYVIFPRPRAGAPPPAPPRDHAPCSFKGPSPSSAASALEPGETAWEARVTRWGELEGVAKISSLPQLISQQRAPETGLKLCLQSSICCLILGKTFLLLWAQFLLLPNIYRVLTVPIH